MSDKNFSHSIQIADAETLIQHVFIRDLTLPALIGVYSHEKENPQPIRINLDLAVKENMTASKDRLADVVSYVSKTEFAADPNMQNMLNPEHYISLAENVAREYVENHAPELL